MVIIKSSFSRSSGLSPFQSYLTRDIVIDSHLYIRSQSICIMRPGWKWRKKPSFFFPFPTDFLDQARQHLAGLSLQKIWSHRRFMLRFYSKLLILLQTSTRSSKNSLPLRLVEWSQSLSVPLPIMHGESLESTILLILATQKFPKLLPSRKGKPVDLPFCGPFWLI